MNIKEKALQEYQNYKQEQDVKETLQHQKRIELNTDYLRDRIKKVLGEDIEPEIFVYEDSDSVYATIADIPDACFVTHINGALRMYPDLDVPDTEEYEDYRHNPDNHDLPEWATIQNLRDLGCNLSLWEQADWEVKPWAKKEPAEIKPCKFDELTLGQANNEMRSFKVLGVTSNDYGDVGLVVEYLDVVEGPFGN